MSTYCFSCLIYEYLRHTKKLLGTMSIQTYPDFMLHKTLENKLVLPGDTSHDPTNHNDCGCGSLTKSFISPFCNRDFAWDPEHLHTKYWAKPQKPLKTNHRTWVCGLFPPFLCSCTSPLTLCFLIKSCNILEQTSASALNFNTLAFKGLFFRNTYINMFTDCCALYQMYSLLIFSSKVKFLQAKELPCSS